MEPESHSEPADVVAQPAPESVAGAPAQGPPPSDGDAFTFWYFDPGSGSLPSEHRAAEVSASGPDGPFDPVLSSAPTVELDLGTTQSTAVVYSPASADNSRFDALRDQLARIETLLDGRLGACEAGLSQVAGVLASLQADDDERDEQRRNREALYDKLQASRSTFLFQLVQPLIQRLASLYDLIGDFVNTPPRDVEAWSQTLAMLRRHIEQTLQGQGIEPLRPTEGQEFDSRHHHIIATRPTTEPAAGGKIAEVVQAGFLQFSQNERSGETKTTVVRPAKVITWKYSEEK